MHQRPGEPWRRGAGVTADAIIREALFGCVYRQEHTQSQFDSRNPNLFIVRPSSHPSITAPVTVESPYG